ncbi:MAG: ribonuclease P protein component [Bacteroidetes bacterium]|nr:ribonuclease P protein component [Bacteroidota bacterium]
MKQTFRKDERLHRKSLITKLFEDGNSFNVQPLRVTTLRSDFQSVYPVQLLISVPRHLYKRAVDRNLLKRRIREGFRKNKEELYTTLAGNRIKLLMCIRYQSKEILPSRIIQDKINVILRRLLESYGKTSG